MSKPYQKSIRYSEYVKNIIESMPGDGFNEQFENLVTDYKFTEEVRRKKLQELDKQIAEKEKLLRNLSNKISGLRDLSDTVDNINSSIDKLKKIINGVRS